MLVYILKHLLTINLKQGRLEDKTTKVSNNGLGILFVLAV